jgi:hypothetical protein
MLANKNHVDEEAAESAQQITNDRDCHIVKRI